MVLVSAVARQANTGDSDDYLRVLSKYSRLDFLPAPIRPI